MIQGSHLYLKIVYDIHILTIIFRAGEAVMLRVELNNWQYVFPSSTWIFLPDLPGSKQTLVPVCVPL